MVRGSQVRFESTKYVSVRTKLTTKRFLLSYTDMLSSFSVLPHRKEVTERTPFLSSMA
jgi:hypothetical protein